MDFRPGTRRLDGLSSWNPEAGWTFVLEPRGCRVNPFFNPGGRPLSMSFSICCILPLILRSYLDPEIMWEPEGSPFDPEIVYGPGGHVGNRRFSFRS
ncbi:hypothetical protein F2Q69_00043362 [Brassica cretica]|uniref:Uncharacterized protein n=1 Tax=Brassica cretica TaxID=69181 RepID=A0A8S9N562_BRACR|nr:hypothetical protein F2Q69_00043362 [Brassica cretica]